MRYNLRSRSKIINQDTEEIIKDSKSNDTLQSSSMALSRSNELESNREFFKSIVVFVVLLLITVGSLYAFFQAAPEPRKGICDDISVSFMISGVLPTWVGGRNDKIGTVKTLWKCAVLYKTDHPGCTVAAFSAVYITMQMFSIPGPIVLSILAGALYPFIWAQVLVAFCATTGASLCFMMSYLFGRPIAYRLMPQMMEKFAKKISENRGNLMYYMLFLRITPLLPNWFVNIASPIVKVEFFYFLLATLVGLAPANFLHISTGATLNIAAGANGGNSVVNFAVLFVLQFVALIPAFFKNRLQAQYSEKSHSMN